MRGIIGAASAALFFAVAAAADPIRVRVDHGGAVQARAQAVLRIAETGRSVEIDGECRSACTMYLGLWEVGRVCVTPRAVLMFHAVTPLFPPTDAAGDRMTRGVLMFYPRPLRAWFLSEVGLRNTAGGETLTGAEVVAITGGLVPFCDR